MDLPCGRRPRYRQYARQHFDCRFRTTVEIGELQTEEVSDAAWRSIDVMTDPDLRDRLAMALLDVGGSLSRQRLP